VIQFNPTDERTRVNRRNDARGRAPGTPAPRVALYSQGMVGFGHIRRNASIAQALRGSALQPAVLLIAEAWQAGALLMPPGVDCVTVPALRAEPDSGYKPRFLPDLSAQELLALRTGVIRSAMEAYKPDVFIVDCLPLGAAGELETTLESLKRNEDTRCVLGLRDVLYDRDTVKRTWASRTNLHAIRDYYDSVWIYGDPAVFDPVREYGLTNAVAEKARYTGYLDQRPRLELARAEAAPIIEKLPSGPLALCVVGGGHDGGALANAFIRADLPPDTTGVLVTGPLMPWKERLQVHREAAQRRFRFHVLDFLPDPAPLVERADRIIAMGGYNTICEALSFEKHALIVPRVKPEPEQWIRAQRLRDLGLVEVLHPGQLSARALTEWLARDPGPAPSSRSQVDLGGLTRIPALTAELLGVRVSEVPLAA
jgi:predicted glycosyltransferase